MSTHERERVISISLTEAEWQAFIARQPRPVDWLRARILDEVGRDLEAAAAEGTPNHLELAT
jgi:hypothetical protein